MNLELCEDLSDWIFYVFCNVYFVCTCLFPMGQHFHFDIGLRDHAVYSSVLDLPQGYCSHSSLLVECISFAVCSTSVLAWLQIVQCHATTTTVAAILFLWSELNGVKCCEFMPENFRYFLLNIHLALHCY